MTAMPTLEMPVLTTAEAPFAVTASYGAAKKNAMMRTMSRETDAVTTAALDAAVMASSALQTVSAAKTATSLAVMVARNCAALKPWR